MKKNRVALLKKRIGNYAVNYVAEIGRETLLETERVLTGKVSSNLTTLELAEHVKATIAGLPEAMAVKLLRIPFASKIVDKRLTMLPDEAFELSVNGTGEQIIVCRYELA